MQSSEFFQEFKKRNIFRYTAMYVVGAWAILQTADVFLPILDIPDWALKTLIVGMIVGFPVVLAAGWLTDFFKRELPEPVADEDEQQNSCDVKNKHQWSTVEKHRWIEGILILAMLLSSLYIVIAKHSMLFKALTDTPPVAIKQSQTALNQSQPAAASVAVLPFVNFSSDVQDEYFADGLAEEILNVLAKIKQLKVAARTSSFAFKGENADIRQIARALNVEHILEGSVRRNQQQVRVTAQLIKAADGYHVWSKTFDFEMKDVFSVQDQIAKQVMEALQVKLLGEQKQMLAASSYVPENMEAYSLVKKGEFQLNKRTQQSIELAQEHFNKAIEIDDQYAHAYSGLALSKILLVSYGNQNKEQLLTTAHKNLEQAQLLDDSFADLYAAKGLYYLSSEQMEAARKPLEKAIELNPNHAMAHMWLGNVFRWLGDEPKSYELHLRAAALDPLAPVALYNVAHDYYQQGQIAQAMGYFNQIVELDPNYPGAYKLVSMISFEYGRLAESLKWTYKAYSLNTESVESMMTIARHYALLQEWSLVDKWIEQARFVAPDNHKLNYYAAMKALNNGSRDEYVTAMEKLVAEQGEDPRADMIKAQLELYLDNQVTALSYFQKAFTALQQHSLEQESFNPATLAYSETLSFAILLQKFGNHDIAEQMMGYAESALQQGHKKGVNLPSYHFKRAEMYAAQDKTEAALEAMQQAIDSGWLNVNELKSPSKMAFQALEQEPRFQSMLQQVRNKIASIKSNMPRELLLSPQSV